MSASPVEFEVIVGWGSAIFFGIPAVLALPFESWRIARLLGFISFIGGGTVVGRLFSYAGQLYTPFLVIFAGSSIVVGGLAIIRSYKLQKVLTILPETCFECGYNVSGSTTDICTECGHTIGCSNSPRRKAFKRTHRNIAGLGVSLCLTVITLMSRFSHELPEHFSLWMLILAAVSLIATLDFIAKLILGARGV